MTEQHLAYVYSLAHLAHLGDRAALKLKRLFPTHQSFVGMASSDRRKIIEDSVGSRYSSLVTTNWDTLLERATKDLERHEREDICVLTIDDSSYPPLLRTIPDPPLVLFVKGSLESLTRRLNVAIVGTRNSTPKGEEVATRIARFFGTHEFCIVSGLAKGIDTAAHKGALDANAPTVAVFGTPLDKVYPAENRPLADAILKMHGSWISEIPLSRKPHRSSFVQRDRIQSGISIAVIPVQTDLEGGTMHTVEFAEQQKRLLLCPRPLNGEQHLKQYAGIAALIESKRATPFQSEDYDAVLERVRAHGRLLNEKVKESLPEQLVSVEATSPHRSTAPARTRSADEPQYRAQAIDRLTEIFTDLGLANSASSFDEAISLLRRKFYGISKKTGKAHPKLTREPDMQIFKARLSKLVDETLFAEKWKERSGGIDVRFRFNGTDLTATHVHTLWNPSREPGNGGFFNVLQIVLHDIARDCTILDCEEITNVNA
jgi:DNA processing protein